LDYIDKSRYAYGYSPFASNYSPSKKDIRIPYNDFGAKVSFMSTNLDSTEFSYDFNLGFNYFTSSKEMYQRKISFSGMMSKSLNEFYVGSGLKYIHYGFSDFLSTPAEYVASISPFLKKSSEQWSFKLGLEALLEKDMTAFTKLRVYPDVNFTFNIVPSYVSYFAALSGKLEKNEPSSVILENPYMIQDGSLYKQPSTSHDLVISTGLKGNTGIGGNYILSASYSLISDMLFFSNISYPNFIVNPDMGNYFSAITDDVDLLNFHGEMGGPINDKLSFIGVGNLYKYTLSKFDHPWNKSNWDGKFGLKYNLRDKIIAGIELTAQGKRYQIVNGDYVVPVPQTGVDPRVTTSMPVHFNLNLSAEYRYSKILSFWTKLNNISNNQYYEWTYYPTHRFMFMFGFTYSL
jgi:hypothetical protein